MAIDHAHLIGLDVELFTQILHKGIVARCVDVAGVNELADGIISQAKHEYGKSFF